jgi:hypothetical protein
VTEAVAVAVDDAVAVAVSPGVAVAVNEGVTLGVKLGVTEAVTVAVAVSINVAVTVGDGVIDSVGEGEADGDACSVGVSDGVTEGRIVAETLGLGDGVSVTTVGDAMIVGEGVNVDSTPSTVANEVAVMIGGGKVGCCPGACK